MLSRVADSLYWMSRYLERAEHTARLIDVNLNLALDQSPRAEESRWPLVLYSLQLGLDEGDQDAFAVTRYLTMDPKNSSSILACVAGARENARQVRGQISSEMWEQLNRFYLTVRNADFDRMWQRQPYEFFRSIKEGIHFFQGTTDSTMNHGEGWYFIQLGRYIERAVATSTLLDFHYRAYLTAPDNAVEESGDYLEWVGLLKSCTAFEAFTKVYTADLLQPDRVAEFLVLNPEFPHSVRFAVDMIQASLQGIAGATAPRPGGRVNRLSGRLHATLSYSHVDDLMADDIHAYLTDVRQRCAEIHNAIYETYVAYPFEMAATL